MAAFAWFVSLNSSREIAPRVREAKFGDGYAQSIGDGINTQPRSWSVRIDNTDAAEADAIDTFLVARDGSEAFDWTDPRGHVGRWVCKRWNLTEHGGGVASISATFEEVFGR